MNKAFKSAVASARAEFNNGRTTAAIGAVITALEEAAKVEPKAPAPAKVKPAKATPATTPAPAKS